MLNQNPYIEACQVTKKFGDKTVVDNISLTVFKGEIIGLLGPSGAGKTTLVKIMAGINEATGGYAQVLGTKLPKLNMLERIGYMAQADAMYSELSAKENMEFFGSLMGLSKGKLKDSILKKLELVKLTDHMNRQVASYSGGMKRRLSLAIALMHEPEVLILDEPTVGIDPVLRKSIWDELNTLSRDGTAILVTTHVMDEAEKCHRLGMIRDGKLIAAGSPAELKEETGSHSLEEAFLCYGGMQP